MADTRFFCRLRSLLMVGVALALTLNAAKAQGQNVGTAAAANTRSSGTPPGSSTRVIELGTQVVRREKIDTSSSGSVQLLFVDKTTFNIGPNSTVVIDDFVFNPDANSGQMAASLTRGVLRVVGGQASHTGGTTIKTPSATIGIRGGIATISHCGAASCQIQGTRIVNHFGTISVSSPLGTEIIRRPGFAVTVPVVAGAGGGTAAAPSSPTRVSQAEVDGNNAVLTSKPGQRGGSSATPSDQGAARVGLGAANVNVSVNYASVQGQTASEAATSTQLSTSSAALEQQNITQSVVNQASTQAVADAAPTLIPPPAPPPPKPVLPPVPQPRAFALLTSTDPALGSGAPFLLGSFAASGRYQVSPVLAYGAGGTNPDGSLNKTIRLLQASLNITGSGASQTSTFSVATGELSQDGVNGYIQAGGFNASSRLSATAGQNRAQGSIASTSAVALDSNYVPVGPYTVNQNINSIIDSPDSNSARQFQAASTAFTNAGTGSNYTYSQQISNTTTPAGLGSDRPTVQLSGYVGGLGRTIQTPPVNGGSGSFVAPSFQLAGGASISLSGTTSRLQAVFTPSNLTPQAGDTFQNAQLNFGTDLANPGPYDGARGTYIDSSNFGARSQRTFPGSQETSTVNGQVLSTLDPSVFSTRTGAFFVTSDTVNAASFFPGVTFCQCDYTKWGFWSMDIARTDAGNANAYLDRSNLATWVAGRPASAADVPLSGTATYVGHIIASVKTSGTGAEYITAGNLTNVVNYATRTGAVSVPNLDNVQFQGNVSYAANSTAFSGVLNSLTAAHPNRTINLNGQFYQGSTNPVGEMGGSALIQGPGGYIGAGTFAARR